MQKQLFTRLTDYQNNYKNYQNPYLKHMRYYQFDLSYNLHLYNKMLSLKYVTNIQVGVP